MVGTIEIRIHGRGGQGAVIGAEILADALFREGKYSQKIPVYGAERRGAPVVAFVRFDEKPITLTCGVYNPDCIVVLDPKLQKTVNVAAGLKEGGVAILNETKDPEDVDLGVNLSKIATVDATSIAVDVIGPQAIPITNTVMLGALSKATGWIKLESLFDPIRERFPGEIGEKNIKAAEMGYEKVRVKEFRVEKVSGAGVSRYVKLSGSRALTLRELRPCPAVDVKNLRQVSTGNWRIFKPVVDQEKCVRCKMCYYFCPEGVITVTDKGVSIDYKYCKGCGICANECRVGAIKMVKEL